jgi:hypothetical protein
MQISSESTLRIVAPSLGLSDFVAGRGGTSDEGCMDMSEIIKTCIGRDSALPHVHVEERNNKHNRVRRQATGI